MTVGTPPWAVNSNTHPARILRNMLGSVFGLPMATHANSATATTRGGAYGVINDGLLVSSTGSLGYSITPGSCVMPGVNATGQGLYTIYSDGTVTGTLAARHATNPRISYLVALARDTEEDATTFEDASIIEIAGTPAASPVVPSIPSTLGSLCILAEILVPPGATALTFTDRRKFASAIGGRQRCTSSTRPTAGLFAGLEIYETDTERILMYSGSGWVIISEPKQFISAGLSQGGGVMTVTTDTDNSWYRRSRGTFELHMSGTISGGTPQASQAVLIPFGGLTLPHVRAMNGQLVFQDVGTTYYCAQAVANTVTYCSWLRDQGSNLFGVDVGLTVAVGDVFSCQINGAYV